MSAPLPPFRYFLRFMLLSGDGDATFENEEGRRLFLSKMLPECIFYQTYAGRERAAADVPPAAWRTFRGVWADQYAS